MTRIPVTAEYFTSDGEDMTGAVPVAEWPRMLGERVEIFLVHVNHDYAPPEERPQWRQWAPAEWIDHNGGGWTWNGLCGRVLFVRPNRRGGHVMTTKLSPREIGAKHRDQIRALLAQCLGISRREIAARLGLSEMAVGRHLTKIRAEWGGRTRQQRGGRPS